MNCPAPNACIWDQIIRSMSIACSACSEPASCGCVLMTVLRPRLRLSSSATFSNTIHAFRATRHFPWRPSDCPHRQQSALALNSRFRDPFAPHDPAFTKLCTDFWWWGRRQLGIIHDSRCSLSRCSCHCPSYGCWTSRLGSWWPRWGRRADWKTALRNVNSGASTGETASVAKQSRVSGLWPLPHAVPEQTGAGTTRTQKKSTTCPAYCLFSSSIKVCFDANLTLTSSAKRSWLIHLYLLSCTEQMHISNYRLYWCFCHPIHLIIKRIHCLGFTFHNILNIICCFLLHTKI